MKKIVTKKFNIAPPQFVNEGLEGIINKYNNAKGGA